MEGSASAERPIQPDTRMRQGLILGLIIVLGAIAGLASARLPLMIIVGIIGAVGLFALIYHNLQIGIILFLILNLTLPQAGPGLNLGLQMAIVGETQGLHFNIHEIIMAMVLVAWLIQVFLKKAEWKTRSPLMIPVVLYILTSILASFVGLLNDAKPLLVAFRFTRTVIFVYLFFVFINIVRKRKQLQQLVVVLLICVTLVSAFGLMQKVMGQAWTETVSVKALKKLGYPSQVNYVAGGEGENQAYRINSTFLHPNVLGAYLILALPFFVSLLWLYRKWWQSLLLGAGLLIMLSCLFLTGSRAAWIGAGVVALIYGVLGFFDKRMILTVITVILVIAVLFAIIKPPAFVKQRFVSLSATQASKARLYQYKLAVDFFMAHPFFGVGMGMEGQMLRSNNIVQMWAAVENVYLTYLVSHGLIGFIPFLLLFVVFMGMLLISRNNSKDDPFMRYYSEAFLLGLVGFAVSAFFGAWLLFAIPMVTLFWAFLGMGACLYNMYKESAPESAHAPLELPLLEP